MKRARISHCALLGALFLLCGLPLFTARNASAQPQHLPVVAVFPPLVAGVEKPTEQAHLALLMQAHAVEYLEATERYSDLHIKQILRMAEHEGRSANALHDHDQVAQIAARLGADRLVYGTLSYESDGWRLEVKSASLSAKPPREVAAPAKHLPRLLRDAIAEGGRFMASQIAQLDGVQLPEQLPGGVTATKSAEALAAYGRCYAGLINQSFRIDSPVMLSQDELAAVENHCTQAAAKDPAWKSAEAAKLLVQALRASQNPQKNQQLATQVANQLAAWDSEQGYQPFYFLAAYWLATCFVSADNGMAVLDEALKHHPHSLIFHSYRGRHLLWSGRNQEAEAAWRAYLALNPNSAYVRGGLSHALSQNAKRSEAISEAKRAYDQDHGDREALVELASRYIDAAQYKNAIDLLLPASQPTPGLPAVRGDLFLRLGYAYLKKQPPSLADAERALKQAVTASPGAADWKLRARAHLDLAELYKKSNRAEQAAQELELARGEKGARLYVLRKLEKQSLDQVSSARTGVARAGANNNAVASSASEVSSDRRPPSKSPLKLNLCIGLGTCSGLALTANGGGAIDTHGLVAVPASNGGESDHDVGTNRVEVGGAPHPYSGSGFWGTP